MTWLISPDVEVGVDIASEAKKRRQMLVGETGKMVKLAPMELKQN